MPRLNVEEICDELKLSDSQCKTLGKLLPEACPPCTAAHKGGGERKVSRWQECITKERKGKPFDPAAIKELAKRYHAGKCP